MPRIHQLLSESEKYGTISVTQEDTQRQQSCAITKSTLFAVSKGYWLVYE